MKPVLFGALSLAIAATVAATLFLAQPAQADTAAKSGPQVGEKIAAFHPMHVSGPNAGTDACPPCTYGNAPLVLAFINGDSDENVLAIAEKLEKAAAGNKEMQTFAIFITTDVKATEARLKEVAEMTGFSAMHMSYLPADSDYLELYGINMDAKNTILVVKDRTVKANFVDITAEEESINALSAAIETIN